MKLILTTVEFSRYRHSKQIYDHHFKLFGPSLDDFKIKEMLKQQGAEEKLLNIPGFDVPEEREEPISTAQKIIEDTDRRKNEEEELIIIMGTEFYKKICYKMNFNMQRTLMDQLEFEDVIIKDDSVMMQLRQDC